MKGRRSPVWTLTGASAAVTIFLFLCSTVRHALFKSNAYDLGWFDQMVYLLSRGQPPITTLADYHLLGDHAAIIFYPIALLYRLYADVHWLFLLQALALALGILALWLLARQAGLPVPARWTVITAYLLYPLVFNVNLYDFHPEVLAIPALLVSVWAARAGKIFTFTLAILFILSCKAVLALTVAAMGFWLLVFERRQFCGAIALILGSTWFLLTTQIIIPQFSGAEVAAVARYGYLGDSVLQVALNLVLKPGLVLGQVFSLATLEYLALLLLPLLWGLRCRHLTPLVAALPALALNILSTHDSQRNLVLQYSVPILPFLLLAVISAGAAGRVSWPRRWILAWSLVGFLALAKYGYFWTTYLATLDTWSASRAAIARIETKGAVIAPAKLAPHLSHRQTIQLPRPELELASLKNYDYVLLDQRHPGFASSREAVGAIAAYLAADAAFEISYARDGVVLYQRLDAASAPEIRASEMTQPGQE
ncbi:MAG: DUF2079 domain-containing protein [Spirulinaceae cyanobacterium SM2_1_0]|nr:DUF2079 domain-containing protein [Spirulinaceae cyanobacterium SM2_1_0]